MYIWRRCAILLDFKTLQTKQSIHLQPSLTNIKFRTRLKSRFNPRPGSPATVGLAVPESESVFCSASDARFTLIIYKHWGSRGAQQQINPPPDDSRARRHTCSTLARSPDTCSWNRGRAGVQTHPPRPQLRPQPPPCMTPKWFPLAT